MKNEQVAKEKVLLSRKSKKISFQKVLPLVAVIIFSVAAGIVIGLLISSNRNDAEVAISENTDHQTADETPEKADQDEPSDEKPQNADEESSSTDDQGASSNVVATPASNNASTPTYQPHPSPSQNVAPSNPPAPYNPAGTYGLGGTFTVRGLKYVIGNTYTFYTVHHRYSQFDGYSAFCVPLTITNVTGSMIAESGSKWPSYKPDGEKIYGNANDLLSNDLRTYGGDILPNSSLVRSQCVLYYGDGEYTIAIPGEDPANLNIFLKVSVRK